MHIIIDRFFCVLLLMEDILGCIKPSKSWDNLPTSSGWPDFFHQQYVCVVETMTQPKGLRLSQVGLNMVEARLKHISSTRWWFQIFFILTPNRGEIIQFDEHIFEMGQSRLSFSSIAKLNDKTRWGPWSLLSLWSQWPFRWSENKRCELLVFCLENHVGEVGKDMSPTLADHYLYYYYDIIIVL